MPYATRHLTANNESAMTMIYGAVPNCNIFRWQTELSALSVLAGFQADGIIPHIEHTVLHDNMTA
ncbi:hypothetical protein D3C76_1818090 [compost metagenome]